MRHTRTCYQHFCTQCVEMCVAIVHTMPMRIYVMTQVDHWPKLDLGRPKWTVIGPGRKIQKWDARFNLRQHEPTRANTCRPKSNAIYSFEPGQKFSLARVNTSDLQIDDMTWAKHVWLGSTKKNKMSFFRNENIYFYYLKKNKLVLDIIHDCHNQVTAHSGYKKTYSN